MKDSCSFKQLQLQLSFMQNIAAVEKETFDPNLSAVWDMGYCCFENLVHTIELVYVPVIHLFSGVPGLGVWDLCFENWNTRELRDGLSLKYNRLRKAPI